MGDRHGVRAALAHRYALIAIFGAFSLCAVIIGAYICARNGVPSALWLRNLAAWGVGALFAFGLSFVRRREMLHVALWAMPLALLATFLSPPQEGVHRWIDAGPLHINAAMLTMPASVVAFAMLARDRVLPWGALFASLLLLVLQPDASQATTLAAILVVASVISPARRLLRMGTFAGASLLAVVAWFQRDPLQPVPEVEDVIELAFATAPMLAVAALVALALTVIGPGLAARSQPLTPRVAGWALSLCFLGWIATTLFGAYPVPWVGIGLSPIIGAWLGIGLHVGSAAATESDA
ncbi:MAG: hypothetical protein K2P70_14535 [Hyphomonadaceae bacterium]|nr:hypothetical protein [Hyphomonadaceae bacterium]